MSRLKAYQKGLKAEQLAADHLKAQGYKVLKMRYKTPYGEIDIVAQQDRSLVFVEVKARNSEREALEAVSIRAQNRIAQAALHFTAEYSEYYDYDMRFDVIAIVNESKDVGGCQIRHLDNAWRPQA